MASHITSFTLAVHKLRRPGIHWGKYFLIIHSWVRYEINLPVPANLNLESIGVLMKIPPRPLFS